MNCYIENNPEVNPRLIWPDIKERIEYAFTVDSAKVGEKPVRYYWFDDVMSMSVERSYAAMVYWHELSSSCTKEYLEQHAKAMDVLLNDPKGPQFTKIAKLNEMLKERLNFAIMPNTAYKMVGVIFFDESEDPTRVDYKHLSKKAKDFAECPIDSFFFLTPISKYVPIGNTSVSALGSFLDQAQDRSEKMMKDLLSLIA